MHRVLYVQAPADAFLAGLQSVVPRTWLNLFNQGELQMLIGGGAGEGLDLADLQVCLLPRLLAHFLVCLC